MANERKEAFFDYIDSTYTALTYDDVLIDPARSYVATDETNIQSRFSRNVDLNIPMVSAAMDTVTNSVMAIAMAKLGGIGVIHAGLTIEEQKKEVRTVKLDLNAFIDRPITVTQGQSVESVLNRGFKFSTFPVVDNENRLVGILTGGDIEFSPSPSKRVKSVMTPLEEVVSAPEGTTVFQAYRQMATQKKKMLPILSPDGKIKGLYLWSNVKRIVRGDDSHYNVDNDGRLRVAAALPTDEEALERVREMGQYLDVAVIDTAQGDSRFSFETLELLKSEFPDLDVVVGNISVGASARDLAKAGADGLKIGQGPGSICNTRVETGMGRPQVTAIHDCARAIEDEFGIPICADGGIVYKGDIPIAIAAGAHSVMMGSKLAGTDEAPGEVIERNGAKVMLYRGMGSPSAIRESAAARKRYGQRANSDPLPEGVESLIPYKGSVDRVVTELVKALRKSMAYYNAANIEYLRQDTTLSLITGSGIRESHPHDVQVIK